MNLLVDFDLTLNVALIIFSIFEFYHDYVCGPEYDDLCGPQYEYECGPSDDYETKPMY